VQVQLSDDTPAVVVGVDRDHPFHPKVKRVSKETLEPASDVISLRRHKELQIVSISQVNISGMYPPEKPAKIQPADNSLQAPDAALAAS
jgi:hypothetical protein